MGTGGLVSAAPCCSSQISELSLHLNLLPSRWIEAERCGCLVFSDATFSSIQANLKKNTDIFELEAWPEQELRTEPSLHSPLPFIRKYYCTGCNGSLLPTHFFLSLTGLSSSSKMSDFRKVSLLNQGFKPRVRFKYRPTTISWASEALESQQQKWADLWKSLWQLSATCKARKCHGDAQPGQNPRGQQLVALQPSCTFAVMVAAGEMHLANRF